MCRPSGDIMPTIADITGAEAPTGIDGNSFLPTLTGIGEQLQDGPLYWEYHAFGGMQAVRMGSWKGVRLEIRRQEDSPVLLFDLANDPHRVIGYSGRAPGRCSRDTAHHGLKTIFRDC